ncbi:MAG: signal peptidase II [Acidimicrobiia bacterium]|nr:MAG: signal peptidase II [Acidimicrobiia bacterium]
MTTDPKATSLSTGGAADSVPNQRSRFSALWIFLGALVGALAIDQVSKELALHALSSGPITLGGLRLHLVANRGILLGFPAPTSIIVLATVGVVIVALRSAQGSRLTTAIGYGLLAGGALGNLSDRFQDRHIFPSEAVVDWISVGRITFNLADLFLVVGVVVLVFLPGPRDSEKAS